MATLVSQQSLMVNSADDYVQTVNLREKRPKRKYRPKLEKHMILTTNWNRNQS